MSRLRWCIGVALFAVSGCSSQEGDKGDVASSYESDLKVVGPVYLGTIASGDTKTSFYSDPPKYRAYGFDASGGDVISIDVRSPNGDAMAWLTDETYATALAFNDDANANTLDSHIDYTVPDGTPTRSYRIVFRDYARLDATFQVSLAIQSAAPPPPPPPACDPASEPWRDYRYTPAQCATIRYSCARGYHAFQNACGCGCE